MKTYFCSLVFFDEIPRPPSVITLSIQYSRLDTKIKTISHSFLQADLKCRSLKPFHSTVKLNIYIFDNTPFLVQFAALVLCECLSYPITIGIITEISLTQWILNGMEQKIKWHWDIVIQNQIHLAISGDTQLCFHRVVWAPFQQI